MFTELIEVSFHDVWKSNCYAEVLCVNYISIKLKGINRKPIFIISKLIFAYPLILQKKERGKKRKEDKSDSTLGNGACQHLSVEHIIFSF